MKTMSNSAPHVSGVTAISIRLATEEKKGVKRIDPDAQEWCKQKEKGGGLENEKEKKKNEQEKEKEKGTDPALHLT